jgi:hypothetical protein
MLNVHFTLVSHAKSTRVSTLLSHTVLQPHAHAHKHTHTHTFCLSLTHNAILVISLLNLFALTDRLQRDNACEAPAPLPQNGLGRIRLTIHVRAFRLLRLLRRDRTAPHTRGPTGLHYFDRYPSLRFLTSRARAHTHTHLPNSRQR